MRKIYGMYPKCDEANDAVLELLAKGYHRDQILVATKGNLEGDIRQYRTSDANLAVECCETEKAIANYEDRMAKGHIAILVDLPDKVTNQVGVAMEEEFDPRRLSEFQASDYGAGFSDGIEMINEPLETAQNLGVIVEKPLDDKAKGLEEAYYAPDQTVLDAIEEPGLSVCDELAKEPEA